MTYRRLAFIGLVLGLCACNRDAPEQLCAGRDAEAAVTRMAAERVNRAIWLQPPLAEAEAKGLLSFASTALESHDPQSGLITCKTAFSIKAVGGKPETGNVRFTIQKLAGGGGGYVFGSEDMAPLVQSLSRVVGVARAEKARPPAQGEATPPKLEDLPPPVAEEPAPPTFSPPPEPLFDTPGLSPNLPPFLVPPAANPPAPSPAAPPATGRTQP